MKLKPCPFCGKEVKIDYVGDHGYDLHTEINCCVKMFGNCLTGNPKYDEGHEKVLTEYWNRRTEKNNASDCR